MLQIEGFNRLLVTKDTTTCNEIAFACDKSAIDEKRARAFKLMIQVKLHDSSTLQKAVQGVLSLYSYLTVTFIV